MRKKFGFYVIDGLSLGLTADTPNLKELLFDGLHPTPPTHETMGKYLAKKLIDIKNIADDNGSSAMLF